METKKGLVKVTLPNHRWYEEHKRDRKSEYIVHLLWAELEFDIKFGITKRLKLAGVKGKQLKEAQFTDSDKDWLLRTIDTALGNVRSRLVWACENGSRFATDELLEQPEDYNLVFNFDDGWQGSPKNLMNYIHTYVVQFALAEWLEMAGMQSYAACQTKAETALQDAYKEMNYYIIDTPVFRL